MVFMCLLCLTNQGTVKLVFQPAEEGHTGGYHVLQEGILDEVWMLSLASTSTRICRWALFAPDLDRSLLDRIDSKRLLLERAVTLLSPVPRLTRWSLPLWSSLEHLQQQR
jgi:hypothetical protein